MNLFFSHWILYAVSVVALSGGSTTESSDVTTQDAVGSNEEIKASNEFLHDFPQSALSLLGVGLFILLSMAVAYGMERMYIRLSIRDDSSDMSEGTKNILKASVLGMMFRKKDEFANLEGQKREDAIAKKYVRKWRYNMIKSRQRRKKSEMKAVAKPVTGLERVKLLCGCCGAKQNSTVNASNADLGSNQKSSRVSLKSTAQYFQTVSEVAAKPGAVASSTKSSPVKTEPPKSGSKIVRSHTKSEFVAVEMKMAGENTSRSDVTEPTTERPTVLRQLGVKDPNTSGLVGLADTSLTSDEFAIDINPQANANNKFAKSKFKSGSKQDLSKEEKYTAAAVTSPRHQQPKLPKLLRPLTAGKSRQIAPGGAMKSPPPTSKSASDKKPTKR